MLLLGDCNDWLKEINDNSIDLITTDPPYGIEFMGKDWDKALVSTDTWKECYRVLKPGKLAFIMCSPRQDVLARMIIHLQDAGFRTNYTSIYWTYASGFPKAANISKLIDKKNGRQESEYKQLGDYIKQKRIESKISTREISTLFPSKTGGLTGCLWNWENAENVPTKEQWQILKEKLNLDNRFDELIEREEAKREVIAKDGRTAKDSMFNIGIQKEWNITKPATEEAKKMEGAYVGFQPKPAVEVILVVSKGKTLTWLDDCRIPYQSQDDYAYTNRFLGEGNKGLENYRRGNEKQGYDKLIKIPEPAPPANEKGRFPANLLVQDDILNDGKITKSQGGNTTRGKENKTGNWGYKEFHMQGYGDEGSYSRYFDLDAWNAKTFPFIITPKASKSERNKGCEDLKIPVGKTLTGGEVFAHGNSHATVKPLKLMSYLITLGSREGDLVLDPFCGSGTVCIAADNLHRKWIGIEKNEDYAQIIKKRLMVPLSQLKMEVWH